MTNGRVKGFALPTVLITSVAMMIILLASLSALASIAQALNNQYYQQLAQEAAESGIARVNDCLSKNAYIAQWSDSSQLRPNTTCTGGSACTNSSSCYVLYSPTVRSTFSVGAVSAQSASQTVNVTGTIQLLSSTNGNVVQSYTTTTSARVGANQNISNIAFGYTGGGAYFLTRAGDGTVRGVGANGYGYLGNGTSSDTVTPQTYILPTGKSPVSVFTNFLSQGYTTFVLNSDGSLYAAGLNASGQLGQGYSSGSITTPVQITLPYGRTTQNVYSLGFSNYIVTTDGYVYSAGACDGGDLGTGYTVSGCTNQYAFQQVLLPTPTSGQPNTYASSNITGDYQNVYVLMQGGAVYGWGVNNFGEQATGDTNPRSTPVRIGTFGNSGQPKAIQIATDGISIWILDDTGAVYSSGYNGYGQLGDGTTTNRSGLAKVQFPASAGPIVKLATDQYAVLGMSASGQVWGFGGNQRGQLGNGTTSTTNATAVQFILPSGVTAVDVVNTAVGGETSPYRNTYVIGSNGKVYGAGANDFGQLGDGTTTDRSNPVAMSVIDGSSIIAKQVLTGFGTTVVLTTNGKIYTVGNNGNGQLGDGTTTNSSTPKANQYTNVQPTIVY